MPRFILLSILLFASLAVTSCAKRSRATRNPSPAQPSSASLTTPKININTAPAKDLEALPGIGRGLAQHIVEHREKYGPFRRTEHLMMVRGISETRFHALRDLVTVE